MNKAIIILSLLIGAVFNSYGQWYVSKYDVSDINFLTEQQLEESLKHSKKQLLNSGGVALAGGGFFLVAKFTHNELDEDATLFEQILGEKGIRKLGMFTGAALFAGGTIAGIVQIGRIGRIKSTLKRNFSYSGNFNLAPALIYGNNDRKYYPGLTFTCHF